MMAHLFGENVPMTEQCRRVISWSASRCQRKAWKDGYCKQHHPAVVKERQEKQTEKWDAQLKAKRRLWAKDKLAVELFDELAETEIYDERRSYVSCQVDRGLWDRIQEWKKG